MLKIRIKLVLLKFMKLLCYILSYLIQHKGHYMQLIYQKEWTNRQVLFGKCKGKFVKPKNVCYNKMLQLGQKFELCRMFHSCRCYHAECSMMLRNVLRSIVQWLLLPSMPQLQLRHKSASNIRLKSSDASPTCQDCSLYQRNAFKLPRLLQWAVLQVEHSLRYSLADFQCMPYKVSQVCGEDNINHRVFTFSQFTAKLKE